MAIRSKQPIINLAVQALHFKKHFPESQTKIERSCLCWKVDLQPTVISRIYSITMRYKLRKNPKVKVISPPLELPERKSEVHVFKEGTLCLYYPGEWNPTMLLIDTIVPWISEWLIHYEIWMVTNKWHGGGVHIDNKVDSNLAA